MNAAARILNTDGKLLPVANVVVDSFPNAVVFVRNTRFRRRSSVAAFIELMAVLAVVIGIVVVAVVMVLIAPGDVDMIAVLAVNANVLVASE